MSSEEEYNLRKSAEKIGELYPVIMSKTGEVVDGFHRLNAKASWRREVRDDIDTPEKVLVARLISNKFRRQVTAVEVEGWINDLAEIAVTVHRVVPGEISGWVAEETGYKEHTIMRYLDEKYKERQKQDHSGRLDRLEDSLDLKKAVKILEPVVDLSSADGLKRAARALEREANAKVKAQKTPEQTEAEKAAEKKRQREKTVEKKEKQTLREEKLREEARLEVTEEVKQEIRQKVTDEIQQDPELRAKIALEERTRSLTEFKKQHEIKDPVIDMGQRYHDRMEQIFYQVRGWGIPQILSMGEKWWTQTRPLIQGINDWTSFLLLVEPGKPLEAQPRKPLLKIEIDERRIIEVEYQVVKEE